MEQMQTRVRYYRNPIIRSLKKKNINDTYYFFLFKDNVYVARSVEAGTIVQLVDLYQLFFAMNGVRSMSGNMPISVGEGLVTG